MNTVSVRIKPLEGGKLMKGAKVQLKGQGIDLKSTVGTMFAVFSPADNLRGKLVMVLVNGKPLGSVTVPVATETGVATIPIETATPATSAVPPPPTAQPAHEEKPEQHPPKEAHTDDQKSRRGFWPFRRRREVQPEAEGEEVPKVEGWLEVPEEPTVPAGLVRQQTRRILMGVLGLLSFLLLIYFGSAYIQRQRALYQGGADVFAGGGWWTDLALTGAGGVLIALVGHVLLKRRYFDALFVMAASAFGFYFQQFVPPESQWGIYVFIVVAHIGLAYRGALTEVRDSIRRGGQVQLGREVQDLLDNQGLDDMFEWSLVAFPAAIQLGLALLVPRGSAVFNAFGPAWGTALLLLQAVFCLFMEDLRRIRPTTSTGAKVVEVGASVVMIALAGVLYLSFQGVLKWGVMAVTVVALLVALGMFAVSREDITRDSPADKWLLYVTGGLGALVLAVLKTTGAL